MSADILRRAARTLREHAEAATPGWYSDAGRIRAPKIDHLLNLDGKDPAVAIFRRMQDEAYAGLMHPPVALALAELLDVEVIHAAVTPNGCCEPLRDARLALALAILREVAS